MHPSVSGRRWASREGENRRTNRWRQPVPTGYGDLNGADTHAGANCADRSGVDGADARYQLLWIGGDGPKRPRRRIEQQTVEQRLVVPGERGDRCGEGEDDMVVLDRLQLVLARLGAAARGISLAL